MIPRFLGPLTQLYYRSLIAVVVAVTATAVVHADEESGAVMLGTNPKQATDVTFQLNISGEMITPSAEGLRKFPLSSAGKFEFQNYPFPTELGGPFTLRAVRLFRTAGTETTVGKDHVTRAALGSAYRTIHVYGSDNGLQVVSPKYALPRKQLDLLEMPFDILVAGALLPTSAVRVGDKWNTDAWVVPMVTSVEAVVSQSTTCELKSVTADEAVVLVNGTVEGAVLGSATEISFSGTLTVDRNKQIIRTLTVRQQEKRSPGPVSPGLEVTATMRWTQTPLEDSEELAAPRETAPGEKQLQLFLRTPQRLELRHSRDWHLFHETPAVLMMRQHQNGNFISQCNISAAVTLPPKQHTPDKEFLADVTEAVRERKGRVVKQETVREDGRWRIRHVQAIGDASGESIIWDYYLCAAVTGEQYSLVFSHSEKDEAEFASTVSPILESLQVSRRRPALPFR